MPSRCHAITERGSLGGIGLQGSLSEASAAPTPPSAVARPYLRTAMHTSTSPSSQQGTRVLALDERARSAVESCSTARGHQNIGIRRVATSPHVSVSVFPLLGREPLYFIHSSPRTGGTREVDRARVSTSSKRYARQHAARDLRRDFHVQARSCATVEPAVPELAEPTVTSVSPHTHFHRDRGTEGTPQASRHERRKRQNMAAYTPCPAGTDVTLARKDAGGGKGHTMSGTGQSSPPNRTTRGRLRPHIPCNVFSGEGRGTWR